MIESKAVRNATATVVSDQIEFGESKFIHQCDKFVPHHSLRIWVMIFRGAWYAAAAITAKIDANYRVVARKLWRHIPPHQAGSRKPMHHKQRGPASSVAPDENRVVTDLNFSLVSLVRVSSRGDRIKVLRGSTFAQRRTSPTIPI